MAGQAADQGLPAQARRVIADAGATLVGSECDGVRVEALFHYGAVDIDPKHLVVWILLAGKPDDVLPEWMKVDPERVPEDCQIDYQWLQQLRSDLVRSFAAVGWPDPDGLSVYADSAHRVDTRGGRHYFRG